VDWLKAEDCQGKAHFKATFDARIRFRQITTIALFHALRSRKRSMGASLQL